MTAYADATVAVLRIQAHSLATALVAAQYADADVRVFESCEITLMKCPFCKAPKDTVHKSDCTLEVLNAALKAFAVVCDAKAREDARA